MVSRRKLSKGLGLSGAAARAAAAGRRSAEADLKVEEDNLRRDNAARLLSLDRILPRPQRDTREVNPDHVSSLVDSIRVLGLVQPIYLDREFRLVAGAHRLEAFRLLAQEDAQRWSKIPVVVDLELDALEQPDLALRKEIVENEKRSNLTPQEVKEAAQRLISADVGFTRRPGRLKQGERALTPFLAQTFGVSIRYVRSLLNEPTSIKDAPSSPEEQMRTEQIKLYNEMKRKIRRWIKKRELLDDSAIIDSLELILQRVDERDEP